MLGQISMRSQTLLSMLFVVACSSTPAVPTTPAAPTASVIELGELSVFEGASAMIKIHANGTTEIGGHSGRMQITPGETASTDSLPITFKPGPTLHGDGSIDKAGKPVARLGADGTIVSLADNKVLPITVTSDKITITGNGSAASIDMTADGTLIVPGADKQLRVQGADTAGKRRAALMLVGLLLMPGELEPSVTAPAEPAKR
jgi:uncharacterized Zn-binding protein involved in type VI secretion